MLAVKGGHISVINAPMVSPGLKYFSMKIILDLDGTIAYRGLFKANQKTTTSDKDC